jgi:DDE_Tnp_1-associated
MGVSPLSLKKHFGTLRDPRLRRRRLHGLLDIIAIAICAVIGNADTWPDIVTFGKSHRAWFKRFLPRVRSRKVMMPDEVFHRIS